MELDISTVKSIWFNGGCIFTEGSEYENKCYEVLNDSFLLNMPVKKIGKRISDFETNKLDILLEAKRQGLKIPHTLITGNKVKLNSFFNLHDTKKGIVSKRILDNFLYEDNSFLYNFNLTFPIDFEILNQLPDEFAISLFQEKITADFEIRVIYLDGNF